MLQSQRLAARGGLPKAPPGAMGALNDHNLHCSNIADCELQNTQ